MNTSRKAKLLEKVFLEVKKLYGVYDLANKFNIRINNF